MESPLCRPANGRLHRVLMIGVSALLLLFFVFIAAVSLAQTSVFRTEELWNEVVLYRRDSIMLNLGAILLTVLAATLGRKYVHVSDTPLWLLALLIGLYTLTVSTVWVLLVRSVPAADSGRLYETACQVIEGDFTAFHESAGDFYDGRSYFTLYPFQLGYLFISEIIYRIFGHATALPMELFNAVCIAAAYVGLLFCTERLFRRRSVTVLLAILLTVTLQPMLFTTFAYGNLPGFAAAVWAAWFLIGYLQRDRRRDVWRLLPTAVLLALAVLAKYNNLIWVVATGIVLIADALCRRRRWLSLVCLIPVVAIPLLAQQGVTALYEHRAGVSLGAGVGQWQYLQGGIEDSWMAPGWYNDISKGVFLEAGADREAADAASKESIAARLDEFAADPGMAVTFFACKALSQWNEPTYECIWVSQVKEHIGGWIPDAVASVYNGVTGEVLNFLFDRWQSVILWLLIAALVRLFTADGTEQLLFPTVLAGGVLYHMLFEAKSQYCLTYAVLMLPLAAYGLDAIARFAEKLLSHLRRPKKA